MNKKILLDGFHVSFDSRVLFMKEAFYYPKAGKEIMKRLLEEGELEKLSGCDCFLLGSRQHIQMELSDDNLIAMFQKLVIKGHKLQALAKQDAYMQHAYDLLIGGEPKIEVDLEGILLLAYGIVTSKGCRLGLERIFTAPEEYFVQFEESEYSKCKMGRCIPAEYLWDMRLVIGVLLKLRETRDERLYEKIMEVIYCGYGALKRDIKKHSHMTGNQLKEINCNHNNALEDAMQMCSQMLITFIIMEELGVEMRWDFSIGAVLPFVECFEEELEEGFQVYSVDEEIEAQQMEWKHRFLENYGTHLSVRTLLLETNDDCNADAVTKIMALFDINPRKFHEYELTEKEQGLITAQNEKWNSKIYWGVLIIAQMCKYIRELEQRFLHESPQYYNMKSWMEEKKKQSDLEKQNCFEKENELLNRRIETLEKSLVMYEQKEKHFQKQIEISESKLQESQEVISNLKEYIYYLSEEHSEEYQVKNQEHREIDWAEKKVLVLGGHPSWHNKLRIYYPKWQFLCSEQKNQLSEVVKGKDYIICNTQMLSHACYYKLLACKEKGQKLLYVRHTNIEQGMLELERQLADSKKQGSNQR